uniref:G_PROTEIN_RECEP_F1_2 domain-containing protein n=1 Tax=Haemonchus contortus TaxID=6289 RepID=A0A7I4Z3W8_HAECO|nr:7TM GPCR domain containing protein [Haemonchus contortus]
MNSYDYTLPVLVIFNSLVLFTYPLHVIFVISLFRNRGSNALGTPFHHLLLGVGISDLISATGYLLFQEPAWLGLAPRFYLENAWWIAKIVNICGIAVSNVPLYLHFFLAINRFTAIRLPARHYSLWKYPTAYRITCTVWIITILVSLPIVYPIEFQGYQMDNGRVKSVAFHFVHPFPTQMYTLYVMCLSVFILPTIILYVYLLSYSWFQKFVSNSKRHVQAIAIKSTIAAFFTSIGDVILLVVLGSQQVYWTLYQEDLMDPPTYWLAYKVGRDLHNIATPWAMLLLFKRLRRSIIKGTSSRNSNTPNVNFFPSRELNARDRKSLEQN